MMRSKLFAHLNSQALNANATSLAGRRGPGARHVVAWNGPAGRRLPLLRTAFAPRALRRSDLWRLAQAHWLIVTPLLFAGMLVGVVGAVTSQPRYVAQTLLMIGDDKALGATPESLAGDALAGQMRGEIALLHSDAVAKRLVQQVGVAALFPDLAARQWFGLRPPLPAAEQMRLASSRVQERIGASAVPGATMLTVRYADASRETALRALRTAVDAYLGLRVSLTNQGEASRAVSQDVARTAEQLRDIDSQIGQLRADYQVIDLEQDTAGATARLDDLTQRESQVRVRQQAVAAEIASTDAALQAAPDRVFDAQETARQPVEQTRATLLALRLERDHLATQYAPGTPALIELERKIATTREMLQQAAQPAISATRDVRNPALDVLRNRANDLRIEAAGLDKQLAALGTDYQQALARVASLREAAARMHDLDYRRGVLEAVGRQISVREMSLRVDDNVAQARRSLVHVIQAPDIATASSRHWPLWLCGGLVGGIAAAGLGGLFAARRRGTYVLAAEIERDLNLAVLAELGDATAARDTLLPVASLLAESPVVGSDGTRPRFSLHLLTPDLDADQQSVARALAAELGDQFDLRTLALNVGADGSAIPFALAGPDLPATLPEKLAAASLPLWDAGTNMVLPRDDAGETGAMTLTSDLSSAPDSLERLRDSFDFLIIVSAGPAAGEAARRLAGRLDSSLLVIAAERTPAAQAHELFDNITSQGGQLLGVVMTGCRNLSSTW